jgi:uncharacterized protein (DUF433 family)
VIESWSSEINKVKPFDRITFDPLVMGGKACIRNMRVTVSLVINLVANGMTTAEILDAYPYLEEADIVQALRYGARLAEDQVDLIPSA